MTIFTLGDMIRVYTAALLTLGAAFIHLAVAPEHLREYAPFGVFFLAVGSAQIVLAVELVARPTRRLAGLLATVSLALVGLWFVSRTVGLPIGPTPGQPEGTGLTDIICNILEIWSSLLFLSLIGWPARHTLRRRWLVALGTLPSAILTLGMTTLAVAVVLNDMPESANAAPAIPGQSGTSIETLIEAPGSQPIKRFVLTAARTSINGQEAWAFNGVVPGPELRVNQGDRVEVTLINNLPESTTIHWHGVQVPNAEDGVAGVTQDAVAPGAEYSYEFVANEAGTFWYHSHQETEAQLPRGLFGPLVVLPAHPFEQRDYTLTLHGGSGLVSINGEASALHLDALPGETVRLRLINAVAPGMDGPEAPVLVGAAYRVVAIDGRDLNSPDLLGPTRIPLGMGQRADLVFTMPAEGSVQLIDTEVAGGQSAVQKFFTTGETHLPTITIGSGDVSDETVTDAPLLNLLHYGAPSQDPLASAAPDLTVPVVLASHPGIRDGRPQLIHTINSQASPNVPPIDVQQGQTVRMHIVNTTAEYHPMHLHGHVLSVIAIDGERVIGSPIHLDSVLVGPNQTVDVAFAADNPGVWMFHCHVLLHAGMGMTTSVNYAGNSTPFEMGTRSGNMPE